MNQTTEAFFTQLRDLLRTHRVDFAADRDGAVEFTSADGNRMASLYNLKDLEALLDPHGLI